MNDPSKRKYFVYFYGVALGNPNGDPDNDNAPRRDCNDDLFTSDVSVKRGIRNYVDDNNLGSIYFKRGPSLRSKRDEILGDINKSDEIVEKMISSYWDLRMFGGVFPASKKNKETKSIKKGMENASYSANSTSTECSSKNPIIKKDRENTSYSAPMRLYLTTCVHDVDSHTEMTLTRVCKEDKEGEGTFGTRHVVKYALFRGTGAYEPVRTKKLSGDGYWVTEDDLKLFWTSLKKGFTFDSSSSKGKRRFVKGWVITHNNKLGDLSDDELDCRITVEYHGKTEYPKSSKDFKISINHKGLPDEVRVEEI